MGAFIEFNGEQIHCNSLIHCLGCRNEVAIFNDYIRMAQTGVGLFTWVHNVYVPHVASYHLGITVANTYCGQCGELIGWKIIAVPRGDNIFVRAGRFCMRLHKLCFSNDTPLLPSNEEHSANAENADQDGDSNAQNVDQDSGANGQNADQGVGAHEQVPNEQELGANEQNVDRDGGGNQQVPNEQDVGANNEQSADQDGRGNEQNHDQDGGRPMKRRRI